MKRWLLVLIGVLLVLSLACSPFGGSNSNGGAGDSGPGEPTTAATMEGNPTQDAGNADGPPQIDANALEELQSYRSRVTFNWEGEDGSVQSMNMEQEETRDPSARRMVVSGDQAGESYTMETIQIGTTTWTNFGTGWMQMEQGEDDATQSFGDIFISPEDLTGLSDSDYEYLGREDVNGIRCRHYRLNLNPVQAGLLFGGSNITDFQAEVWVADDSNLPEFAVRWHTEWSGEMSGETGAGRVIFEQEVYDVNASFTIEPPDEAANSGLPEDVPLYENAEGLFSMPGLVTFNSTDDLATVQAFYDDQLPANGWNQTENNSFEGTSMSTWEKEGRTLSLMISNADDGGVSVMISIEGE